MNGQLGRLIAILAVVAMLVACGGGNEDSQSPLAATATPEPTSTPVVAMLGEVVWTTTVDEQTGAPVDSLTTLSNTAPQVYAAVRAEFLPAGATVQAHWTIDGDELPELDPVSVTAEEDRVDAWISWSLTWTAPEPWPVGTLGIVIDVNGETVAQSCIPIVRAAEAEDI